MLRAGSPAPMPPEPVPLCYPGKAGSPLSRVLRPERGWDSPLTLTPSGVAHSVPLPPGLAPRGCPGKMQARPTLLRATASEEQRKLSCFHGLEASSPDYHRCLCVGYHHQPPPTLPPPHIHTTSQQISDRASSPSIMPSGPAHPCTRD